MADASSTMPADASRLYGKNVTELLKLLVKEEKLDIDLDDEVVAGACLTHDGTIRHEPTRLQIEGQREEGADS
jgi:NAD(P) transhydrogenase subunit alpha